MVNKGGDGIGIRMGMCMKEIGEMILRMVKGRCGIPIWISMMGSGLRGRKMDGGSIFIIMELFMRVTFSMEESKASVQSFSQMALRSKPTGIRHMSKARVKFSTPMVTFSKGNTICPKSTVKECTFGVLITQSTKANSKKTLSRARLESISPQHNTITAVLEMASDRVRVIMFTRMVILLMESGRMI